LKRFAEAKKTFAGISAASNASARVSSLGRLYADTITTG
jgi:hypothetical protein